MSLDFPEATRLPHRPRQQYAMVNGIPLRSPMSIHADGDVHRSMPASPFDMDPRNPRLMSSPFEPKLGLNGPDYFSMSGLGPLDSRYQRGAFPGSMFPPGFETDTMIETHQQYIDEMVRRTNLMVQYVNSQIRPTSRYCQIQPKMCSDSKFPPEFRVPKTVEEIRAMDPSSVDRVLRAYNLPMDLRSLRVTSQDTINPRTAHQAKLCTLFDFLGAIQISERQRVKRAVCLPY